MFAYKPKYEVKDQCVTPVTFEACMYCDYAVCSLRAYMSMAVTLTIYQALEMLHIIAETTPRDHLMSNSITLDVVEHFNT